MTSEAVDVTQQEQEDRRLRAGKLDLAIRTGVQKTRRLAWETAKDLYEFHEMRGYELLGYETLGAWLADPEVTLSRAGYFRLVEGYRELVVIRQIPAATLSTLDVTKVQIALPAIKQSKEPLEDTISNLQALGAQDLREMYTDRVTVTDEEARPDESTQPKVGIESDADSEPISIADDPSTWQPDDVEDDVFDAGVVMDLEEATEELRSACASGAAEPRVPAAALASVLHELDKEKGVGRIIEGYEIRRRAEGMAESNVPAIKAFVEKFREAPRSRHTAGWVEELAATAGL
jgi:hypothetical protein